MRGAWLGAVTLMLLLGSAAHAASFDCSKARTPFAKAICSNPELSKADEKLAATFKQTLEGLSPAAKTEVSSAQDKWVQYANIACTDNAKPATKPYNADAISCLGDLFSGRTTELGNSKEIGGLRFYYIDRYATLKDTVSGADETLAKVATKEVSTPRIDGTDDEAQAFNGLIEAHAKDYLDPAAADHPTADESGEDDSDAMIVDYVDPVRISLNVNTYMYGHGAAHGNYAVAWAHYLRPQKRFLTEADVFAAPDWKEKLQAIALPAVKTQMGDNLMLDDEGSINDLVVDPSRWDFNKNALVLQFEPYEIAPYAAGAPTVSIPWSDLTALLAPGAKDLAAGDPPPPSDDGSGQ